VTGISIDLFAHVVGEYELYYSLESFQVTKDVRLRKFLSALLTTYVSSDTIMDMDTKTINLRDLPEELVRRTKACAALHGITLRDYVLRAITKAVEEDVTGMSIGLVALAEPNVPKKGRKK